eukprot:CAMPEP_0197072968 /NCGR_PEP_ID=MMETSP1384-20130603/210367_1 /TAXON_ID=29189 /ORGANISM="Ammonia sp." /LENGTH=528 /DNA_ID=CAMNT_0042511793 /DNA_START=97 /DNA_END=1683 /DNA_ORIENTATION=-
MSETFKQLSNATVEPSLKKFQDGAVGSIEMLSMGFYGILEAFKDEMQKSRDITEQMEKSFGEISSLKQQLVECNEKFVTLNQTLSAEIKKINKCLSEQTSEIDKKFSSMKQSFNAQCSEIKKECLDAVEAVSSRVGKSLENLDRLRQEFENLSQETDDQLRSLSVRCDENKELIEEQDNKFKDQLNEMTEILHNKALELDAKIESCLNETTEKIQQFDAKQQAFQFEINNELSQKADINDLKHKLESCLNETTKKIQQFDAKQQAFQFEINNELSQKADINDLKHKLDSSEHEQFVQKTYQLFAQNMQESMENMKASLDDQQTKQSQISGEMSTMKTFQTEMSSKVESKFDELAAMINNPVDVDKIKMEIKQQMVEEQAALRDELVELVQSMMSSAAGGLALSSPALGTQNGNCIACGRGPSQFQALPGKSPSPHKKPAHGGGFSRVRRGSSTMPNTARRALKSSGSDDALLAGSPHNAGVKSPTSAKRRKSLSYMADAMNKIDGFDRRVTIETDPIRIKIPDVDETL